MPKSATAFELQPMLRGDLVELRPLCPGDFDALYAVACDPLIWEQHPSRDRYQFDVFQAFFRDALASGGALLVRDARDGRVLGSSRYHGFDPANSEIEIGWTFLARSHWGGQFNGDMKRLMLEHAFRFVDNVVFLIGPENHRSRRAVAKIGAVHIGSRTTDAGRECVVYQITAESFAANRRRAAQSMTIRAGLPADRPALMDIWLRSVRATHTFLTEDDIQALLPLVRDTALPALELWVLCTTDGLSIGFMGLDRGQVEALFMAPEWRGRGGGRLLLDHARRLKGSLTVDVNEQNPQAVGFYESCGFTVVGRSPADAGGRPFPLLHLREIPNSAT